ncbi:MAG: methyltransferase domain-containing protein [bacterium]|nr:methyltransferase domain-containing protein [bacterium]
MKLNLGCSLTYMEGWANLDKHRTFKADIYHDLEEPLPLPDNSCSEINASHIFEHIYNFIPLINECHRILHPAGLLHVRVPWFQGNWGCGDPTHVRYFNHLTFNHWCEWFDLSPHINSGCRFKKISVEFIENIAWLSDPFLAKGMISAIEEMKIELLKI